MRANLLFLLFSWATSQFCYQVLVFYVKHIPGDIFMNVGLQSIIDTVACSLAGVTSQTIGTQHTMTISFLLATIGGVILVSSEQRNYILLGLIITRLGIDCSYCLIYVLTTENFPSTVSARVFGICTLSASVATILSPIIAEVRDPFPMFIYISLCFLSMSGSHALTIFQRKLKDRETSDQFITFNGSS